MDSWVLIPCQRSRLDLLRRLLTSLDHPAQRIVLVATHPDPIQQMDISDLAGRCVIAQASERSISQWWNLGLNYVQHFAQPRHEVAVFSSDMQGTSYSVAAMGTELRRHNLTMVGPNLWGTTFERFNLGDERGPCSRAPGCAWMLAGESNLRCDEQFRWWYADDDIEMQARKHSGVGLVPHTGLYGEADTPLNEEKSHWAVEDRQKFIAKWGKEPW